MRALAWVALSFAAGMATATAAALLVGHHLVAKHRVAQADRDMQVGMMQRVALNALRNPKLLSEALSAPIAGPVPQAPTPRPAPQPPRLAAAPPEPSPRRLKATDLRVAPRAAQGAAAASTGEGQPVAAHRAEPPQPPAAPQPAVAPADVAKAIASVPVEGVSYEKAAVEKVERGAVVLRGGRRVAVGASFPSGEVLLAADPENSRFVTNQRQILLFR